MNTFAEYQDDVLRTAGLDTKDPGLAIDEFAMGLVGEASEAIEILKKYRFQGHPLNLIKVREELGDALWYLTSLAVTVGLSLEGIAKANVCKRAERYPDGFSKEASLGRVDSPEVDPCAG